MFFCFFNLGATTDYYIDSNVMKINIIKCFSDEIQKNDYILDKNGIKLPINSKEYSIYNSSGYSGSLWIESYTEGRPKREIGLSNLTKQSFNDLHKALRECHNNLSE